MVSEQEWRSETMETRITETGEIQVVRESKPAGSDRAGQPQQLTLVRSETQDSTRTTPQLPLSV